MRTVVEINSKYIKCEMLSLMTILVDVDIVRQMATQNDDLLSIRLYDLVYGAYCVVNMNENLSHVVVMDTISDQDILTVDPSTKPAVGYCAFHYRDWHNARDCLVILAVPPSEIGTTGLHRWSDIHSEVLNGGETLAIKTRQEYASFNEMARSDGYAARPANLQAIEEIHKALEPWTKLWL